MGVMIFGVGMFVFFFCEHWPFTQKFALILETLCLYMKMHSYMLSNQELYDMKYSVTKDKKDDSISTSASVSTSTSIANEINIQSVEDVDKITDEQVTHELKIRGLRDLSSIDMTRIDAA